MLRFKVGNQRTSGDDIIVRHASWKLVTSKSPATLPVSVKQEISSASPRMVGTYWRNFLHYIIFFYLFPKLPRTPLPPPIFDKHGTSLFVLLNLSFGPNWILSFLLSLCGRKVENWVRPEKSSISASSEYKMKPIFNSGSQNIFNRSFVSVVQLATLWLASFRRVEKRGSSLQKCVKICFCCSVCKSLERAWRPGKFQEMHGTLQNGCFVLPHRIVSSSEQYSTQAAVI